MIFIREFMESAKHVHCDEGRLTTGTNEKHVYTVSRAGEISGTKIDMLLNDMKPSHYLSS